MTANSPGNIDFAECLARYKALSETAIRVEAELEQAKQNFAKLAADAVRDFGTSDLDELKAMVERRRARNNELLSKFMTKVAQIETCLAPLTSKDGERSNS
jgi:hypothetical protein